MAPIRDPIVKQALKIPGAEVAGKNISKVLEGMTVKMVIKEGVESAVPFASPVFDVGYGSFAAGERLAKGDAIGAKGDELVATAGAVTYGVTYGVTLGGVLVGGTAVCAVTGPFVAPCEAAVIAAAPVVAATTAHVMSETAKQVTANVYNAAHNNPEDNSNFTQNTRGSTEWELGKYAYSRRGEIETALDKVTASEPVHNLKAAPRAYRPRYSQTDTQFAVAQSANQNEQTPVDNTHEEAKKTLEPLVAKALKDESLKHQVSSATSGMGQFCVKDNSDALAMPLCTSTLSKSVRTYN